MADQCTYLYVEDDPSSRDVMEIIMMAVVNAPRYEAFSDSADYMNKLRALPFEPDIYLFDIHMKPVSGFELLKMMRADPTYQSKTIIALTASVMNEEIEQLRLAGFNGAIAKPLNLATFGDALHRIMRGESVWQIA